MRQHPDIRDHHLRDLAAAVTLAGQCAILDATCPNPPTCLVRIILADTLCAIDVPACDHHAHVALDANRGLTLPDGRPIFTLTHTA